GSSGMRSRLSGSGTPGIRGRLGTLGIGGGSLGRAANAGSPVWMPVGSGEPLSTPTRITNMGMLSTLTMYLRRTPKLDQPTDIYDHQVKMLDGAELDLGSLRGKPTLLANA